MNLNDRKWLAFTIDRLFCIKKGKRLTSADQIDGEYPYIGAIDNNNGVSNYIEQKPIHEGNTITVNYNGSVGEAFYQPVPFWATDDVNVLYFRPENNYKFNVYIAMFICSVIKKDKYRWSYGRKWHMENMRKSLIHLPVDDNDMPDWRFMEDYIKSLHSKKISTKNKCSDASKLNVCDWKDFNVGELFYSIKKGRKFNKEDLEEVDVSVNYVKYITRTAENNGCEWFVANLPYDGLEAGNAITIGDTTATCFYQKDRFICGDHMVVLRADWLNEYTGLFITTLLNNEQYKYNYGRAFKMDLIQSTVLRLPVTLEGKPDWKFMEQYIKSLPYGDRI